MLVEPQYFLSASAMASRKTSLIRVTPTNADDVTVTRSLPRTNSSRKLSRNKLSLLPPEIAAFWNRAAMPTDPNVFPPS